MGAAVPLDEAYPLPSPAPSFLYEGWAVHSSKPGLHLFVMSLQPSPRLDAPLEVHLNTGATQYASAQALFVLMREPRRDDTHDMPATHCLPRPPSAVLLQAGSTFPHLALANRSSTTEVELYQHHDGVGVVAQASTAPPGVRTQIGKVDVQRSRMSRLGWMSVLESFVGALEWDLAPGAWGVWITHLVARDRAAGGLVCAQLRLPHFAPLYRQAQMWVAPGYEAQLPALLLSVRPAWEQALAGYQLTV